MDHDHFTINVARRIKHATERFGPYHEHCFKVTMPVGETKVEALATWADMCGRYPEPQFKVTLSSVTVRITQLKESGGTTDSEQAGKKRP